MHLVLWPVVWHCGGLIAFLATSLEIVDDAFKGAKSDLQSYYLCVSFVFKKTDWGLRSSFCHYFAAQD